jgi:hypothetical protein
MIPPVLEEFIPKRDLYCNNKNEGFLEFSAILILRIARLRQRLRKIPGTLLFFILNLSLNLNLLKIRIPDKFPFLS